MQNSIKLKTSVLAMAAAAAGCATPVAGEDRSGQLTLIENVRIVDPESRTIHEDGFIVIEGETIESVGTGLPPERPYARREDLQGRYVMPGLIDTHAHVTLGPVVAERVDDSVALSVVYDDEITRFHAATLLSFGVTTIRNPGGQAEVNVAYREAVETGALLGPSALVAGEVIDRPIMGFEGLVDPVTEDRPIELVVREQAEAGVDMVKFYTMLTEQDLREGQAAADALGVSTVAHTGVNWHKAAEIGLDALVHAMPTSPELLPPAEREPYLDKKRPGAFEFFEWWEHADLDSPLITEMIAALAEHEVHVDATLIAFKKAFWGDIPEIRDRHLEYGHPRSIENWQTLFRFDLGWKPDDYERARAVWPKMLRFVRMLHEAGVPLTLGTDQANPFVVPGASLIEEMELHTDAGIERWEILQMATNEAADTLGIGDRVGRIAEGYEADLVILEGNPSESFDPLLTPLLIVNDGAIHSPSDLLAVARQESTGDSGEE
ncbi:amidohydrolase family protein [Erythrobacter sp. GH1-10]|uniref:amidohydrolase family protein n=1 Tax=Erythrobacter sp. GH1-10 TaxID=3349334 RepID=UPI0038780AFC